jgi:hypothetical protein
MADKSVCLSSAIYRLSAIGYALRRLSAMRFAGAIPEAFCRKPILSSPSPAGYP